MNNPVHLRENIYAVPVPEDAIRADIQIFYDKSSELAIDADEWFDWKYIPLQTGTWKLLFLSKEASEEQAGKVVEYAPDISMYCNYFAIPQMWEFDTALDSFQSLLKSKGLNEVAVLELI